MSANSQKAKITEPVRGTHVTHVKKRASDKLTIVIAEDHDDTREMLCLLYRSWGCRVVEACNGPEAVDAATRERPALILMDGSLPYLDGLGATRRIRRNKRLRQIKIIAMNGWGTTNYTAAALAAGCDDCVIKPLDLEWLRNDLNEVRLSLGLRESQSHQIRFPEFDGRVLHPPG